MPKATSHKVDVLHFNWCCPVCRWTGEVTLETHFGNDRGRHLQLGDCLFGCDKKAEPHHLYFLESFPCPGCSTEDDAFLYVAEIHCFGNRWMAVQTYPALELVESEETV